jgi:DNA-binding NtrC family response regulator
MTLKVAPLPAMAHILVVEDEVTFRTVISAALLEKGHSVVQAGDGRTALALLQSNDVDLIITDVLMPDQDGIDLILKLRAAANLVPVIAMTGYPDVATIYSEVVKTLGARRVLMKPFRMEELLSSIEEVLATGRKLRP